MQHAINLVAGAASSVMRIVVTATDPARVTRQIPAVIRDSTATLKSIRRTGRIGVWTTLFWWICIIGSCRTGANMTGVGNRAEHTAILSRGEACAALE